MIKTNDLKIKKLTPIIAPQNLKEVFPITDEIGRFVTKSRMTVIDIMKGKDKRLMIVVGPCSIHDPKSAIDYAGRLAGLADEVKDELFIVMRVYFEKPRTTVGWKGLINDPDMDGSHEISKGLGIARGLFSEISKMNLPIAAEMLDPITPAYLADMISWGAIGARTTESQVHREMASGLSFPVGFKNSTDGNLQIALDAMKASLHPHHFLGINEAGFTSVVETSGNPDVHIVLRGGKKPNFEPADIASTEELLSKAGLSSSIMVDCSHGNSNKDFERQPLVLASIADQILAGNRAIFGVMIESFIEAGSQSMPKNLADLKYGVSITDKCIDWATTGRILRETAQRLKHRK